MKIANLFFPLLLLLQLGCRSAKDTAVYCGQKFIEKEAKVYLTDEDIETTMVQVTDQKTKKFVFGYHKDAIRNDTNFIYSKVRVSGDTIIRHTYHRFKITEGIDSTVSVFICSKNGVRFHTHKTFWNGALVQDEMKNVLMGQ